MRILFASIAGAIALAAPASAETRSYDLSGFRKIEADAAFEIEFTQGPKFSVVVDSKYNTLDKIIIDKSGDTLRIRRPEHTSLKGRVQDIVRITAPDLDALDLDAAIKFTASNLTLDRLEIDANAAITVDIANLKVDTLDINADAATKLSFTGTCRKLDIVLGAASTLEAAGLKCRETNIDAGTASSVKAYASEKAFAGAGMASTVTVSGHPKDFQKRTAEFGSKVSLAN